MKRYLKIYLLPLLSLLFVMLSCIHEYPSDDTNIQQVKVYFSYQNFYDISSDDDFEDIKRIDLFVFDEYGNFVDRWIDDNAPQLDSSYYMEIPLAYGNYQIISWMGFSDSYNITPSTFENQTTFEECMLSLKRSEDGIVNHIPSRLLYAAERHAVIDAPNVNFKLRLQQLSNTIKITTEGLKPSDTPYGLAVKDNNGDYLFDGLLAPNNKRLEYKITCQKDEHHQPFASLGVMSLSEKRKTPLLSLIDLSTGNDIYRVKLVDLILRLKDKGAVVDFNTIHHYHIHLRFIDADMDVEIIINGWDVSDTDIELSH